MRKTSILRWSGSKTKLLPELRRLAPARYDRYVEPFAGSATLFFEIAPKISIIGDVNPCVIDMYRAIRDDAEGVSATLEGIPKCQESFYKLRALSPANLSLIQRAARLIFLMKACFNGVYRTNKLGIFNVPMGDKIYALPSREELLAAQALLQGSTLLNEDFATTSRFCRADDWVYLDPPYKHSGRFRGEYGYDAKFGTEHEESLVTTAKRLADLGCLVTISYSYNEELIDQLDGWHITPVAAKRSVAGEFSKRLVAQEMIIQNYTKPDNDDAT